PRKGERTLIPDHGSLGDGRSFRPAAVRGRAGGRDRGRVGGARRRAQGEPLDVVRLSTTEGSRPLGDGAALRHRLAGRGAGLSGPPLAGAKAASGDAGGAAGPG